MRPWRGHVMAPLVMHFLAPPWGLPGALDGRLRGYLEDDDWASAGTLLRDAVGGAEADWRWLVLLAYVRFRDASEVMTDELVPAAREALELLERAGALGAPHSELAPLREAAEAALDSLTREEEALAQKWAAREAMTADELEQLAFSWRRDAPDKAAEVFDALLAQRPSPGVKALAALCRGAALEPLLSEAWELPERVVLEEVETALLERAAGAEFVALWQLAEENGRKLDFPFPSAWPHQERLFARAWALKDFSLARRLGERIKAARHELPAALKEKIDAHPQASS